jgi:hypothetical protein
VVQFEAKEVGARALLLTSSLFAVVAYAVAASIRGGGKIEVPAGQHWKIGALEIYQGGQGVFVKDDSDGPITFLSPRPFKIVGRTD